MATIIYNNEIYKDTAMFIIRQEKGKVSTKHEGDLVFIEDSEGICGLNVLNSSKYFESKTGYHTLNQEQIDFLKKHNVEVASPFFTIGEIVKRDKHPTSDKLFLLDVNVGDKILKIVTNSLNSLVGEKVVVANIGAVLPSGKYITHSKVMGVESVGMLCGAKTLCIKDKPSEGVMLLGKEAKAGEAFVF